MQNRMSKHEIELQNIHAVWLLPVVAPIVAAATGSIIAEVLPDNHALVTIIVSYLLWGAGVPLSIFILVIYFHRLLIHKLPPREVVVSVLLPLGPFGQGAFGQVLSLHSHIQVLTKFLKNYAAWQGCEGSIPKGWFPLPIGWRSVLCCRNHARSHHVGLCTCMDILRHCHSFPL